MRYASVVTTSLPLCANCERPATIRWKVGKTGHIYNCDRCHVIGGYDPEIVGGANGDTTSDILTVPEAASLLKVHPETIKRRIRNGELNALPRTGAKSPIRIARDELHAPVAPKRRAQPKPSEVFAGRRSTSIAWPK
jgi:excisionase family DNA binding protein